MDKSSDIDEKKDISPTKNAPQEPFNQILNTNDCSDYKTLVRQRSRTFGESENESLYIHQGPLPPVSDLEKYEQICPGAAKQILEMIANEGKSRQTIRLKILTDGVLLSARGQIGSIFLVSLALVISIAGVFMRDRVALVMGIVLAFVFVVFFEAPRLFSEKNKGLRNSDRSQAPNVVTGNKGK